MSKAISAEEVKSQVIELIDEKLNGTFSKVVKTELEKLKTSVNEIEIRHR